MDPEVTKKHVCYARMPYKERVRSLYKYDLAECPVTQFGSSPLHTLAKDGLAKDIKEFLKTCSEVDIADPESGVTPLMTACYARNLDAAQALIEFGANVNYKCRGLSGYGMKYSNVTPIYIAACQDCPEIMNLLIKKGADVNQKCSPQEYTPLHQAVVQGNYRAVSCLLKCPNTDANIPYYNGMYPVHTAVCFPHILADLLQTKGVDPNVVVMPEKITALHLAAYTGQLVSAKVLLPYFVDDLNAKLVSEFTPLDLAIQEGQTQVARLLKHAGGLRTKREPATCWMHWKVAIKYGGVCLKRKVLEGFEHVDLPITGGSTALHHMVLQENIKNCQFLLSRKADVNKQDHVGNSALHLAAAIGNVDIMRMLLENGAHINSLTSTGSTPLQSAVESGSYSSVKFLINKGADLHAERHEGGNVLFTAVDRGHADIVRLLLKSGLDPNLKVRIDTCENTSVLHIAVAGQYTEIIKILVEAGVNLNESFVNELGLIPPLFCLAYSEHEKIETFRVLIEAGAYIDAEVSTCLDSILGNWGEKAFDPLKKSDSPGVKFLLNTIQLFKSVRKNDLKQANQCYNDGATVNCCSKKFSTPLVYASWKGYLPMVKFLLGKGARVNTSSPLQYAAKFGHKEILVELLRHGADVKQLNSGKSALDMAKQQKNAEITSLLTFVERWLDHTGQSCLSTSPKFDLNEEVKKIMEGVSVVENDLCSLFEGL